jgi:hypothetical protein
MKFDEFSEIICQASAPHNLGNLLGEYVLENFSRSRTTQLGKYCWRIILEINFGECPWYIF